jgi:methylthioribose-1-phosphate isomerase
VEGSGTFGVFVTVEHDDTGVEVVGQFNTIENALVDLTDLQNELDQLEIDLLELEQALNTLNTVTLPGLQSDLDDLDAALNTLNTVTLPGLQSDLDDLDAALNTLNTVTLPGLQSDLDDLDDELNTLNTETLPDLQSDLSDLDDNLGDLNTELQAIQGRFPIQTVDIGEDQITAPLILAGAITTDKMTANTINGDRITSNTLDAGKIVAGSISTDNMTANTINGDRIATNTLNADRITAGTISTDNMTANTINGDRITTNTLDADRITAGTISTDNMTANTINGDRITVNTLNADRITAGTISTDNMTANTINGDRITTNTLNADRITAGTIGTDNMTANTINGDRIAANTLDAGKITANSITATQISGDKLDVLAAETGTLTSNLIRTAATGQRLEITDPGTDATFAIWGGSATSKTIANARFAIQHNGDAKFGGRIISSQLEGPLLDAVPFDLTSPTPSDNTSTTAWVTVGDRFLEFPETIDRPRRGFWSAKVPFFETPGQTSQGAEIRVQAIIQNSDGTWPTTWTTIVQEYTVNTDPIGNAAPISAGTATTGIKGFRFRVQFRALATGQSPRANRYSGMFLALPATTGFNVLEDSTGDPAGGGTAPADSNLLVPPNFGDGWDIP